MATERLTEADLVIIQGRIIGGANLPGKKDGAGDKTTAIYAGRFVPGTTSMRQMPIISLPDDLLFTKILFAPDSVANFGFLKKDYNREIASGALNLITLEVDGKVYRSLAKVNAAKASQSRGMTQEMIYGGACLVVIGMFLLLAGWEKGKT